jgi:protein-S-isoprenylcysteine O-methyltransferase Ste14
LRASGASARIPGVSPVIIAGTSMCAVVMSALFPRMKREDRMMHSTFGEEWEAWARKVNYRIIPGVY